MNVAGVIDRQFAIFAGGSAILFIAIVATMVVFVLRYNRRRHPKAEEIPGNTWLEVAWIIVPTLLVMGMFVMGVRGYRLLRDVPEGAMVVKVTAFQYGWQFEYENGRQTPELYVPVKRPVKLDITSRDVIHSFFAPDLRIKSDAVPGMKTQAWFVLDEPGEHTVLCAEYCGIGHSDMLTKIVGVPQDRFDAWYPDKAKQRP